MSPDVRAELDALDLRISRLETDPWGPYSPAKARPPVSPLVDSPAEEGARIRERKAREAERQRILEVLRSLEQRELQRLPGETALEHQARTTGYRRALVTAIEKIEALDG